MCDCKKAVLNTSYTHGSKLILLVEQLNNQIFKGNTFVQIEAKLHDSGKSRILCAVSPYAFDLIDTNNNYENSNITDLTCSHNNVIFTKEQLEDLVSLSSISYRSILSYLIQLDFKIKFDIDYAFKILKEEHIRKLIVDITKGIKFDELQL